MALPGAVLLLGKALAMEPAILTEGSWLEPAERPGALAFEVVVPAGAGVLKSGVATDGGCIPVVRIGLKGTLSGLALAAPTEPVAYARGPAGRAGVPHP